MTKAKKKVKPTPYKSRRPAGLSRDEESILLYLETRAVDHCGRINSTQMNDKDWENMKAMKDEGFIDFGRICHEDAAPGRRTSEGGAHWVTFSDEAFALAHACRMKRARRNWDSKGYRTTEEKRKGI